MNCDGVRELLSAYVDGELSPGELLRVEQHLRRCPLCAEEVDALRQAIAFVGSLEEVELPAGFREGLRARLAEVSPQLQPVRPVEPLRPAWHRQVRRWALPAAAAAAFALATSGVYGQLGPLLNRVADNGPTPSVNTPSVPAPTETVVTPPPVAVTPNETKINPGPVAGAQDTHSEPVTPSQPAKGDTDPPPNPSQTPIGPDVNTSGPVVASYVDQVIAPEKLERQSANRTTVQALVPDVASACNSLKSAIAGAECTTKEAGRHIEVRFQVPVGQPATDAYVHVQSLIGSGATFQTESLDRAPQLKAAYEQLMTIQEDVLKLAQAVATAKDPAQKQVEEAALARRQDEGTKAVESYNLLKTEVNSQLFVIDLQKSGQ